MVHTVHNDFSYCKYCATCVVLTHAAIHQYRIARTCCGKKIFP